MDTTQGHSRGYMYLWSRATTTAAAAAVATAAAAAARTEQERDFPHVQQGECLETFIGLENSDFLLVLHSNQKYNLLHNIVKEEKIKS